MTTLHAALHALQQGELVVFPTETVLGVGCDAHSDRALQRLIQAKGRPDGKPFTVHLGPSVDPRTWAHFDHRASALAEAFWPGPLTLVLPLAAPAHPFLTGGGSTIGVRVPDHPVAIELLDGFGRGVAASSANRNGEPVATSVEQIPDALGPIVQHVLAGSPRLDSKGSTVLSLVGPAKVLRAGDLSIEALAEVLPELLLG